MIANTSSIYALLAAAVLLVHALFIAWIIFGALLTRSRPRLRTFHIVSLFWGILIELLPWTCPLTYFENLFEAKAGIEPYQGGFLLHYLDKLVYPDVSLLALTVLGVFVCFGNLVVYARRAFSDH